jgi:hypothetical protein
MSASGNNNELGSVASTRTDKEVARTRQSSGAWALISNYVATLQEHIEEMVPETRASSKSDPYTQSLGERASALHALNSIRELLTDVSRGKPVVGTEFTQIINDTRACFVNAGLITKDTVRSLSDRGESANTLDNGIPAWCITKLYEGMASLVREA